MEEITFSQFDLVLTNGQIDGGATALQWGPDGLLYAVGRNGFVYAIDVERTTTLNDENEEVTDQYLGEILWTHDLSAPNFDDMGEFTNNGNRQALGLVVTQDANTGETVVYASHSDITIGAGGGGGKGDVGLDTNSGVITRIKVSVTEANGETVVTENEAIDLIRGLPRSEENHATNGLELSADGNTLYIASGGHANAGAPSVNFVGLPEYTYSGAILEADLEALAVIEAAKKSVDSDIDHVFDMPTLDDPLRKNFKDSQGNDVWIDANFDGEVDSVAEFLDKDDDDIPDWMVDQDGDNDVDADDVANFVATKIVDANNDQVLDTILYQNDGSAEDNVTGVRGGNDALNQAKLLVGNPVQIHSTGYRNTYDVLRTDDDRMYTYDNGANGGWGGVAVDSNGVVINQPNNVNQTKNFDQLHEVTEGSHGGHPNPVVASGSAAGLWSSPTTGPDDPTPEPIGNWRQLSDTPLPDIGQEDDGLVLPADWDQVVDPELINPAAGIYNEGGSVADGALDSDKGSWNGLAEYTGTAFGGQLQGAILVTQTGGDVKWIKRDVNGNIAVQSIAGNNGGPLSDPETIVEAIDQGLVGDTGGGTTLGIDAVGDDGVDGLGKFDNTVWVGQLQGNNKITVFEAGGEPAGADLDKDDDGIDHVLDYYEYSAVQGVGHQLDTAFGTTTTVNAGDELVYTLSAISFPLSGPGGIGQLGYMVNLVDASAEGGLLTANENVIAGGAGSALQIKDIRSGTAQGSANDQRDALTFAVSPGNDAGRLEISTQMLAILTGFYQDGSEAGMQIGTGDQFSYMSIVLAYTDTGGTPALSIEFYYEEEDVAQSSATQSVDVSNLLTDIGGIQRLPAETVVEFLFDVDTTTGIVTPKFKIIDNPQDPPAEFTALTPVQATGNVLDAIQGNFVVNGEPHPLAFGNIGTSAIDPSVEAQALEEDNVNVTYDEFRVVGFAPDVDAFVSITDAAINEDVGTVTLTVALEDEFGASVTLSEDVTVNYTLGGTAQVPGDATLAPATPIVIAAGASSATVTVTIVDDDIVEGSETLDVVLGSLTANGLVVLPKSGEDTGSIDITDNDVPDPGSVVYRVNAGTGNNATSVDDGPDWLGDANLIGTNASGITVSGNVSDVFTQGLTNQEAEMDLTNLASPVPWQLFINERGDNNSAAPTLNYAFDVDIGTSYTVTLYYVENWHNIFTSPDERVFDVQLEGVVPPEFNDIHPLREAADAVDGPEAPLPSGTLSNAEKQPYLGTAFSKSVTYTATDNELNLSFVHQSQNPKINAIEVSVAEPGMGGSVAEVSVADVTVNEADGTATVTFTLSAPVSEGSVTVPYTLTNGTASAGIDFSASPGSLEVVFDGGQTATATILIDDDDVVEGDENFTVAIDGNGISAPVGATVTASPTASTATVTITDNDVAPPANGEVLYRVNTGGPLVEAIDDGPDWTADTGNFGTAGNSPYLADAPVPDSGGTTFSNSSGSSHEGTVQSAIDVPDGTPLVIFDTERGDRGTASPTLKYSFDVGTDFGLSEGDEVEVRLYFAEIFNGVDAPGERIFDVSVDGTTPAEFDDIDQFAAAGGENIGIVRTAVVAVDAQGILDLEFLNGVENPAIKAIEIVAIDDEQPQEVTITAEDISADESTSEVTVTFSISEPVQGGDITLPFTLVNGTATVGEDTIPDQNGSVTFPAGQATVQTVVIGLNNDNTVEGDETFTVELGTSTVVPANVNVTTVDGTVTILDDDTLVDSFNGTAAPGNDWSGTNNAPDDVTLIEGTNTLISTGGGGDADYITFTVADGQQVTSITLTAYDGDGNSAFLGIQQGESFPSQADIENGVETLDGGTVYNVVQLGQDILPLLASNSVENAGQPTAGLETPLQAGTYTLWFNQNQDVSASTLEIVSEATVLDEGTPTDIDGDGILNIDDPFAYDGTNGDAKVLTPGGEFTQDFNTDTADPFSPEGGFSGILVNPNFDYPNTSELDPYGDRTNEDKVSISGGSLTVTSDIYDAFTITGEDGENVTNNTLADGYQSAVDVTGATKFEVHARANSADWLDKATSTNGFEQFGISLGAGGIDDFVKLVISDQNGGAQRVQLAHNQSLEGADKNYPVGADNGPSVDLSLVGDIEFRLIVDRMAGVNGQVTGQVDFFAAANGDLLTSLTTPPANILANSSLLEAMDGQNPLTGGDGNLAYGIFITDFNAGAANEITANYDFLTVRSLDTPVDAAPTVDAGIPAQVTDEDALFSFTVPADAFTDDGGVENLTLSATLGDDSALPSWLAFDALTGTFSGTPTQAEVDAGQIEVKVTATDTADQSVSTTFTLDVTNVNDAPTITGTVSDQTATLGTETIIELASLVTLADEDGDVPTLGARLQGGEALPTGLSFDGTNLTVANTVSAGDFAIELFAADGEAESVLTVPFSLSVASAASSAAIGVIAGGTNINASTFGNSSFTVENTGETAITQVVFDLSTGILRDIVFDPDGTAGDTTAKGFTLDGTSSAVGASASFSDPNEGGFYTLTIDFTDFQPGETLVFGLDTDPTSVKDQPAPGAGESGSVSGLEMVGADVTVTFEDASTITSSLFEDGSNAGATAIVATDAPAAPTIALVDGTSFSTVNSAAQTILITGTPGASVRLLQAEGAIFEPNGGAFDVEPFEANSFISRETAFTGTLDVNGELEVSVTLTDSQSEGGLNHFLAVVDGVGGQTSPTSNALVVEYDADFVEPGGGGALIEVTTGQGLDASTEDTGAFKITNLGDAKISEISIDLSTAILPDMVFDPTGAGGDGTGLGLTADNGAVETGFIAPTNPTGEMGSGTSSNVFQEQDGLVVIEMESGAFGDSWQDASTYSTDFSPNVNNPDDAAGDDFIIWQAGQFLSNPGNGLIEYEVEITNPGLYQFQWRNQVGNGTATADHNDSWLKIEADQFYGIQGNPLTSTSFVIPKGAPAETAPDGATAPAGQGAEGWFKVYSSGANNWSWSTKTSDFDAHDIFAQFDAPGTYKILVSARSNSHAIDRMVLHKVGDGAPNDPLNLSNAESPKVTTLGDGPFSQPREGGYDIVTLAFEDFETSESFSFSLDVDPNSIQGETGTGTAGIVSGSELAGATVTITYDNGETDTVSLFEDDSAGGANAVSDTATILSAPTIELVGFPDAVPDGTDGGNRDQALVADLAQTVLITGTPGAYYSLLQMDGRLVPGEDGTPFNVGAGELPFYANEALDGRTVYTGQLDQTGQASVAVTLLETPSDDSFDSGGLNHFVAVTTPVPYASSIETSQTSNAIVVNYDPELTLSGEAILTINEDANGIETSNFGNGSFEITNTGNKAITFIEIDVTDSVLVDAVFDPFGLAGDNVGKILTPGGAADEVGLVTPQNGFGQSAIGVTYLGAGETDPLLGFEKLRLEFTDFAPGESFSFGIDMDPNSIAGSSKGTLDSGAPLANAGGGANPVWDVGGVGGAELSGGLFTVGYADGGTSTGKLQGQGTGQQIGAKALSSEFTEDQKDVSLTVNGLIPGAEGFYGDGGPQILIQGEAGQIARVLVMKGFIVPFANNFPDTADPDEYHDQLDAQLAALEASGFPANNAVELLYVDVELDGTVQDISDQFDFTQVVAFDLSVPDAFNEFGVLEEDKLPLGIVASVIDPETDLPQGDVTSPIHLVFSEVPQADLSLTKIASDTNPDFGDTVIFTVTLTNDGPDTATGIEVLDQLPDGYGDVSGLGSVGSYDPETGVWSVDSLAAGESVTLTLSGTVLSAIPATPDAVVYRVNPGSDGPNVVVGAPDSEDASEPDWLVDTAPNNQNGNANSLPTPSAYASGITLTGGQEFPGGGNPSSPTIDLSLLPQGSAALEQIFRTERFGVPPKNLNNEIFNGVQPSMEWDFAVQNGDYTVNLYFAEIFAESPGERVFDVEIEDQVVLSNYDIYVAAGNATATAVLESFDVTVTDSNIDIDFTTIVDNAKISGIEIIQKGDAGSGPLVYTNTAEIIAAETLDPDSTPGNGLGNEEDDEASVAVLPVAGGINLVTVTPIDADAAEGDPTDPGQFVVTLEEIADADTIVTYTIAGTATPDTDYTALTGTVTVTAGQTSAVIDVTVLDDLELDPDETVEITLTELAGDANLQLGTQTVATVTIADDELPPVVGSAKIEITPDGDLGATTFGGSDKIQITNNGPADIKSISIDFSTGILPDMVWDPTGSGGDETAQVFTAGTTAVDVGLVAPGNPGPDVGADDADPFSQPRNGGWDVITLNFTDFNQGEFFSFTSDVDPNSIQGIPNAGFSGAVSGYELIGSTVTVTFTDGTSDAIVVSSLYEDGSLGGGQSEAVIATETSLSAPTIELLGAGPDESELMGSQHSVPIGDTDQTVRVTGEVGANVSLLLMDTRLFINGGAAPFDVTEDELPFYANEAMSGKTLYTGVIGVEGFVDIAVELLTTADDSGDGGINHFVAVLSDGPYAVDSAVSQTSNTLVVIQSEDAVTNTAPEITSGDAFDFVEGAAGPVFTAAATDPEDDPVTFELNGQDAGSFSVDENTGEVSFTGTPVFEAEDIETTLTFNLVASDGELTDVQTITVTLLKDSDGDLVGDRDDNAVNMSNPDQRDTDGDGIGNIIDADFRSADNPNVGDGFVDVQDLAVFAAAYFTDDADADFDGSGFVDLTDLAIFSELFFQQITVETSYELNA